MFAYFKIICGGFCFVPDVEKETPANVQKQEPSEITCDTGEGKTESWNSVCFSILNNTIDQAVNMALLFLNN